VFGFDFNKRKTNLLGLDIGSSSVKLVELGGSPGAFRLEGYAIVPLPAEAVAEGNIRDLDWLSEAIGQCLRQCGATGKQVAMAVAGSAVITKVIEMDAGLSEEQLETMITLEADQYIPYPLEEVALDFSVIGPVEGDSSRVQVLLAACRRENVDTRVRAVEMQGLSAAVMDVEAYALQRAVAHLAPRIGLDQQQVVAVVDFGGSITTLTVFSGGQIRYTREQLFGSDQLLNEIKHRYGLSQQEALTALRSGGLPEGFDTDVLQPFLQSVMQQITRSLQFFFSSTTYNDVDHILLSGEVAGLPGLEAMVNEDLGTPATLVNPFKGMEVSSRLDKHKLQKDAPALMVACGLAMRRAG